MSTGRPVWHLHFPDGWWVFCAHYLAHVTCDVFPRGNVMCAQQVIGHLSLTFSEGAICAHRSRIYLLLSYIEQQTMLFCHDEVPIEHVVHNMYSSMYMTTVDSTRDTYIACMYVYYFNIYIICGLIQCCWRYHNMYMYLLFMICMLRTQQPTQVFFLGGTVCVCCLCCHPIYSWRRVSLRTSRGCGHTGKGRRKTHTIGWAWPTLLAYIHIIYIRHGLQQQ